MKALTLSLSVLICIAVHPQKKEKSSSRWNNYLQDASEIPVDDFEFFKKGNFYHVISNDNDNFYIDLRVEDTKAEAKILREGLVVWINADGKQHKEIGVRYPVGTQNTGKRGVQIPAGVGQVPSGNPNSPIAQATVVELIGFPETETRFLSSNNPDNFRGSVRYDDKGILHYRLIFPVAKLNLISEKGGTDPVAFTLGIEPAATVMRRGPGGPPPQGAGAPPSGGAAPIPAGGGGRGGRGGPGGGPGGGMPSVPAGTPNPVLWIKDVNLVPEK